MKQLNWLTVLISKLPWPLMQKTNNRWEHVLKDVSFYEFIAVLNNVRVKVIVKEVVGGEKYFWSIIPFWKINRKAKLRILHGGDPEHD